MTRKFALSRLENAILSQLVEAGAEEVTAVINSVSGVGDRQELLVPFERALHNLHRLALVVLVDADRPGYPLLSSDRTKELLDLGKWLRWEPNGKYWTPARPERDRGIAIAVAQST